MDQGILGRNAPYGTSYTPTYRMKIIGGKPVYVAEKPRGIREQNERPAVALAPSENVKQTNGERRQSFSNHSVLPPITSSAAQSPYAHNVPLPASTSGYSSLVPTSSMSSSMHNAFYTSDANPSPINASPNGMLTDIFDSGVRPNKLSRQEEFNLLTRISADVRHLDTNVFKQLYNEMTEYDPDLSGWAFFKDFVKTLHSHGVNIRTEDIVQAAGHSAPAYRPNKINYESLLAFIASAIHKSANHQEAPSKYYEIGGETNNMSIDTRPSRPEGEIGGAQGKLMRLVEEQLSQADEPLDLEKLRAAFALADRLHRQSMSHGEIKEICYRMRVPLQESVVNRILDRCRTTGDGQYRWSDFIDFLEKLQPAGTALQIHSKRPTEYIKKMPSPRASWPKEEFQTTEPPTSYIRKPYKSASPLVSTTQLQMEAAVDRDSKAVVEESVQTDEVVSTLAKQNGEDPWFQRFTKLAEALYRNDLDRNGTLNPQEARWMVMEYNNAFDLRLSQIFIDECIQRNTTAHGTNIDSLLKSMLSAG